MVRGINPGESYTLLSKKGNQVPYTTPPSSPILPDSVPDPDPPDPHVFGPPGSGSTCQRYGSGSFYHHAKIVRKTLILYILGLFL
jgi:hypothetical protein